jgi:hypothetical protein
VATADLVNRTCRAPNGRFTLCGERNSHNCVAANPILLATAAIHQSRIGRSVSRPAPKPMAMSRPASAASDSLPIYLSHGAKAAGAGRRALLRAQT